MLLLFFLKGIPCCYPVNWQRTNKERKHDPEEAVFFEGIHDDKSKIVSYQLNKKQQKQYEEDE